jgi:hypothetical protein
MGGMATSTSDGTGPGVLRVAGIQLENAVGDLDGNTERILDAMRWAEEQHADVVLFPELALTGYPLRDLVVRDEFVDAALAKLAVLAERSERGAAIVGAVDRVPARRSWDSQERNVAIGAAVLCGGQRRGVYHKTLLPNYEVFNEARTSRPATTRGRSGGSARPSRASPSARTAGRATARRRCRPGAAPRSCSCRTPLRSTSRSPPAGGCS